MIFRLRLAGVTPSYIGGSSLSPEAVIQRPAPSRLEGAVFSKGDSDAPSVGPLSLCTSQRRPRPRDGSPPQSQQECVHVLPVDLPVLDILDLEGPMIRVLACLFSPRASRFQGEAGPSVHGAAGVRALLRSWLSDLPPHALEGEGVHPSATGNHAAPHARFPGGTTRVSRVGALSAVRLLSPRCPGTRVTGRRTPRSPRTSSSWRTCRDRRGFGLSPRPPPPASPENVAQEGRTLTSGDNVSSDPHHRHPKPRLSGFMLASTPGPLSASHRRFLPDFCISDSGGNKTVLR